VLLALTGVYINLEMFVEARNTLQEALDLSILHDNHYRHKKEPKQELTGATSAPPECSYIGSAKLAECHSRMSELCKEQAMSIKRNIQESSSIYAPGSTVMIHSLQNQPEYNQLQGVVIQIAADKRVCVRMNEDMQELRFKPENVRPLVALDEQRRLIYITLQDLADEGMACGKENLRIQLKLTGVKHVNTATAYFNLGSDYMATYRPAETREAVAMITKAERIMRRVAGDDDPRLLRILMGLSTAQRALARFEKEDGVLSAAPCWWPATSRQQDEAFMSKMFVPLHRAIALDGSPYLPADFVEQVLRMHGLFYFMSVSSDPVDLETFVEISCNELQRMKEEANYGAELAPTRASVAEEEKAAVAEEAPIIVE